PLVCSPGASRPSSSPAVRGGSMRTQVAAVISAAATSPLCAREDERRAREHFFTGRAHPLSRRFRLFLHLFSQDFSLSRPATSSHESAPQTSPFQQLAGSFE